MLTAVAMLSPTANYTKSIGQMLSSSFFSREIRLETLELNTPDSHSTTVDDSKIKQNTTDVTI